MDIFSVSMALAMLFSARQGAVAAPTPADPVEREFRTGYGLLAGQRLSDARAAFERADRLAKGRCFRCLESLAATAVRLRDFPAGIAASRRAIRAAAGPGEQARAQNQLGLALAAAGDAAALREAEKAYLRALALDPKAMNPVRYNLAIVLFRTGRDADGRRLLDEFLRGEPPGARADQARALRENPRRAGETFLPQFSFPAVGGGTITRSDLAGRVVLLDFWATWCAPCRQALPELALLARAKKGEPFEIVSVSADRDLAAVKAFVAANRMIWKQAWDQNGRLSRDLFRVTTYPTYLIVDSEGVVVHGERGWSPRTAATISAEVTRALAAARATRVARR